ncbi:MAG: hypothetical protein JXX29_23530 [Deltaproteobacteria bacterium]|nr:hypothetical protein [Deltaproteobacteria bacterium]MBN2674673.1 hypothetical protein [Deltaproteobacteria bacterium]
MRFGAIFMSIFLVGMSSAQADDGTLEGEANAPVSADVVSVESGSEALGMGEEDSDQLAEDPTPTAETDTDSAAPNPEMVEFQSTEPAAPAALQEDPLDEAETNDTLAVIGAATPASSEAEAPQVTAAQADVPLDVNDMLEQFRPYGQGDMELSIGIGGSGAGGGFTLSASALFAYYVVNRLAPGLEIDYLARWGDVKYPQSFTLFPFLKFVLIRSHQFAPYLLVGGGRTMAWGGGDGIVDSETGDFSGIKAVGSWVTGMGGGFMIGIGARMRIQIQLLAMHRVYDEKIRLEPYIEQTTFLDADGNLSYQYSLEGEETDKLWYPAPSFWFSFAL